MPKPQPYARSIHKPTSPRPRADALRGQGVRLVDVCIPAACSRDDMLSDRRDPGVELVGQLLGSGFLAATMRAPLGTAVLVGFMSSSGTLHEVESAFLAALLLTNFIAVGVNRDSAIGQKGY